MTMAIESLVVDDEPLARDLLAGYVKQTPFLHFAGACSSAVEALTVLQREKIDLIFLDIQMPQLNGLELSRMIGTQTRVVFTTAFEQYALEGFRVDALDYLLKPISYAEFLRAADKAQRWFGLQDGKQEGPVAQGRSAQTLFVKTEYKMVQLRLDQILYIEGVKDYVKIHTEDGASVMTLMSMKAIEETLPADRFVRVHRSFIVHVDKDRVREGIYSGVRLLPGTFHAVAVAPLVTVVTDKTAGICYLCKSNSNFHAMSAKTIDYTPVGGVCSKMIHAAVEDGKICEVVFVGGCHGNTQGICSLVKGMPVDEAIARLKGIDCRGKGTSCPDQLARALEQVG